MTRPERLGIAMEERIRPTKSGLFSIELLICVITFVFCAAVCTGIFVRAEMMSRESAELNLAVSEARSLAECYQAAGGDLQRVSALAGGSLENGALIVRREALTLCLTPAEADGYALGTLTVCGGERTLIEWTVAALEAEP